MSSQNITPPWRKYGAADFVVEFEPLRKGNEACWDRTVNLKNNRRVGGSRQFPKIAPTKRYKDFRRWMIPILKKYANGWRQRFGLVESSREEFVVEVAYRPPGDNRKLPDRDGTITTVMDLLKNAKIYKDDDQVLPLGSWQVDREEGVDARMWIWVRPIRRILGTYGPEYEVIEENPCSVSFVC